MIFVGRDESGERMEIMELADHPSGHPFYLASQYHPEFKSRPGKPAPLFLGFILASGKKLDNYLTSRRCALSLKISLPTSVCLTSLSHYSLI